MARNLEDYKYDVNCTKGRIDDDKKSLAVARFAMILHLIAAAVIFALPKLIESPIEAPSMSTEVIIGMGAIILLTIMVIVSVIMLCRTLVENYGILAYLFVFWPIFFVTLFTIGYVTLGKIGDTTIYGGLIYVPQAVIIFICSLVRVNNVKDSLDGSIKKHQEAVAAYRAAQVEQQAREKEQQAREKEEARLRKMYEDAFKANDIALMKQAADGGVEEAKEYLKKYAERLYSTATATSPVNRELLEQAVELGNDEAKKMLADILFNEAIGE